MSISALTSATDSATDINRTTVQSLSQDEFLKLLVTQMTTQDPMNPQTDTEFLGQMAQFSSLEQTRLLQQEVSEMHEAQALSQAGALLGQTVQISLDDGSKVSGVVSEIQIEDGKPQLLVGGKAYSLDQVASITTRSTEAQTQGGTTGQTATPSTTTTVPIASKALQYAQDALIGTTQNQK